MTIGENRSANANGFAHGTFDRKSASVHLRCDVLNDDALSAIRW